MDKLRTVDNTDYQTEGQVNHDGLIDLMVPGMFKSYCDIEMSHYPFDIQQCHLEFVSWSHRINEIDVVPRLNTIEVIL